MRKLLNTPLKKSLLIVGAVADVYTVIQIIKQTRFKVPELFSNPWTWLFVIITATIAGLLVYFGIQDYKRKIDIKFSVQVSAFETYKKAANEKHNTLLKHINDLYERNNALHRNMLELQENSKTTQPA